MFARGFISSHRAALSASRKHSANSNYSRTYATPGGRGCTGLLVRPLPLLYLIYLLYLLYFLYFRGHTNVSAAGGRSVLQRCLSLRGAAARSAARSCWAWSKGRERR